MEKLSLKKLIGFLLTVVSGVAIIGLVFFYSTILFSNQWPSMNQLHDQYRLMFSIPSGITVIYAVFMIIIIPLTILFLIGLRMVTGKKYITKLQILILGIVWIISIFFGSATTVNQVQKILQRIQPFSNNPIVFDVATNIPQETKLIFRETLRNEVREKIGMPIEGYEPKMFMTVFPGLSESDFEGVEASVGSYAMENGRLTYKADDTRLTHSAAKAITDRGMDRLLSNISVRLTIDLSKEGTVTKIIAALVQQQ